MSGRTDWKEIFGKPEQGFVNRVHATLDGLTEAGTSRCTPQHFRRRRLLTLTAVLVLLRGRRWPLRNTACWTSCWASMSSRGDGRCWSRWLRR